MSRQKKKHQYIRHKVTQSLILVVLTPLLWMQSRQQLCCQYIQCTGENNPTPFLGSMIGAAFHKQFYLAILHNRPRILLLIWNCLDLQGYFLPHFCNVFGNNSNNASYSILLWHFVLCIVGLNASWIAMKQGWMNKWNYEALFRHERANSYEQGLTQGRLRTVGEKYGSILDLKPVLIQLQDNYSINTWPAWSVDLKWSISLLDLV